MSDTREFDIVLFGATGFTGQLTAAYLASLRTEPKARVALAGRNLAKLEMVKRAIPNAESWPLVVARSDDALALAALATRTRVVLTTVGPYAQHGEPLVRACVEAGTDYVDITGEPDFVDAMIARYDAQAEAKGVRIVHCCGFDSIPHDLGVLYSVQQLSPDAPKTVEGFVRANGTFSGGTWQSAVAAMGKLRTLRGGRVGRAATHGRTVKGIPQRLRYDREMKAWACPLPTIDPQIVLRSARAIDAYGPTFKYGHYAEVRSTATIALGAVALGAMVGLAQFGPTRELLLKVRASGEGPSEARRAKGWFKATFRTRTNHETLLTRVSGGDPGYTETAKMVSESALCLAFDRATLPVAAGVLTPAVAMGAALQQRLIHAGIRFEVLHRTSH